MLPTRGHEFQAHYFMFNSWLWNSRLIVFLYSRRSVKKLKVRHWSRVQTTCTWFRYPGHMTRPIVQQKSRQSVFLRNIEMSYNHPQSTFIVTLIPELLHFVNTNCRYNHCLTKIELAANFFHIGLCGCICLLKQQQKLKKYYADKQKHVY